MPQEVYCWGVYLPTPLASSFWQPQMEAVLDFYLQGLISIYTVFLLCTCVCTRHCVSVHVMVWGERMCMNCFSLLLPRTFQGCTQPCWGESLYPLRNLTSPKYTDMELLSCTLTLFPKVAEPLYPPLAISNDSYFFLLLYIYVYKYIIFIYNIYYIVLYIYVYGCFAHMHVCELPVCLAPTKRLELE